MRIKESPRELGCAKDVVGFVEEEAAWCGRVRIDIGDDKRRDSNSLHECILVMPCFIRPSSCCDGDPVDGHRRSTAAGGFKPPLNGVGAVMGSAEYCGRV